MKIRNGFVSNSSSSSFVLFDNSKENINSTIISMLEIVDEDCKYKGKYLKKYSKFKKTNNYKEFLNGKIGICFPSSNYDTYIFKKDNSFVINTCRNHTWDINGKCYGEEEHEDTKKTCNKYFVFKANKLLNGPYSTEDVTSAKELELFKCTNCNYTMWDYFTDDKNKVYCGICNKSTKKYLKEYKV